LLKNFTILFTKINKIVRLTNLIFVQINILRVHENVIAIMMTSIARASQDSGEQTGEAGGAEEVAVAQESGVSPYILISKYFFFQ
jgi:hypothetical protein